MACKFRKIRGRHFYSLTERDTCWVKWEYLETCFYLSTHGGYKEYKKNSLGNEANK